MNIASRCPQSDVLVLTLAGRLDGAGADALLRALTAGEAANAKHAVLDLAGVNYLSSAGLRVLLADLKRRRAAGGGLVLAAVQPYCLSVLEIAGFDQALPRHDGVTAALAALGVGEKAGGGAVGEAGEAGGDSWAAAETFAGEAGALRVRRGSDEAGFIEVAGDINDVLASRITPAHVFSKRFSQKAYSIGLGGLGATLEDYFTLMGEMITIGGTMVWLPCDGSGRPDFLIPKNDSGQVLLRTGFNASLAGPFNDYVEFVSAKPEGATMGELYRLLFDFAKARRPAFKGALGLAMRAQMPAVFGAGVVRAPVAENAPANGLPITDPANFADWFEFDKEPRHRDVTGLIAGCGIDLTSDLSGYTREFLEKTFYYNPANSGASGQTLHNHVVAFNSLPMPEDGCTLEGEIASVVERGDFIDMRHLLDSSTVKRAVIGLIYAQDFRPDAECLPGHAN